MIRGSPFGQPIDQHNMAYLIVVSKVIGAVSENKWVPGIGDPSLMGWLTVFAYFMTAIASIFCAILVSQSYQPSLRSKLQFFWWSVAGLLIFLGVNKQLDLQSWLTSFGRDMSREWGWYDARRDVQKIFILLFAGTCAYISYYFASRFQPVWKRNKLACLGLLFLSVFVIGRAASFHHMDQLINLNLLGLRVNWILELGGISCITMACISKLYSILIPSAKFDRGD